MSGEPTDKYKSVNHHHEIQEDQFLVNIGNEEIVVDTNMLNLLVALNAAGIKTRSHCGGHGSGHKWVAISLDGISIDIRKITERDSTRTTHDNKFHMVIGWQDKGKSE